MFKPMASNAVPWRFDGLIAPLHIGPTKIPFEKGIIPYPKLHLKKVKLVEVQGVPLLAKPD